MSEKNNYEEISKKFRKFFELPSSPVGIKIISEITDEQKTETPPMRFCEMVRKSAYYGEKFVFSIEELTCTSGELALGFTQPIYGEVYPRIKNINTKLVSVEPLEKMDVKPDVVIIIGNPRKIMRVSTIISQLHEKQSVEVKFKGEFAVCGECTAIPYMENKVNMSLLCNGARMFSGYRDDEIAMGFPFDELVKVSETTEKKEIISALCGCIMDDLPSNVIKAIQNIGFEKGTDHFFGRFDKEIVRLYTPKDEKGKITSVTLHIPVKLKNKDIDKIDSILQKPLIYGFRENWIDIALPIELNESINRATMRGEKFEALIKEGIEAISKEVRKLRRVM